ncbi:MAG: regulator SirB [Gallionella sp.]|nr:MAG: regulator SirB [Gallionella sp.]
MSFLLLKAIHVTCAASSFVLFFLRGIWSLNGSPIMRQRWVKLVPHIVDTLLLASAIALAFTIRQYPFVDAWLTAKVAGLLLYIGLGLIALRYGRSKTVRLSAWLAAQAVFVYIVLVAGSHNPIPFIHQG